MRHTSWPSCGPCGLWPSSGVTLQRGACDWTSPRYQALLRAPGPTARVAIESKVRVVAGQRSATGARSAAPGWVDLLDQAGCRPPFTAYARIREPRELASQPFSGQGRQCGAQLFTDLRVVPGPHHGEREQMGIATAHLTELVVGGLEVDASQGPGRAS